MAKPAKRGRPAVSRLPREEQLRLAKQRHRQRAREAGLKTIELKLPQAEADRLRVALEDGGFRDAAKALLDRHVVDLQAWPALRELAWNRSDRWIAGREALALYERNWRHVLAAKPDPREMDFIRQLAKDFGGGHLNV